jgi:flavin reductase (DIM6/NTAB) family NADH-FMN oxidoreductase RutF
MTANAFMSVSLNPKLITVSVDKKAQMYGELGESGKFAVSILAEEQQNISMHFAGQKKEGRGIDFDFIQDVSVIQHALTTMVCNMHSSHHVGDHTLYVGEVVDIGLNEGNPLTFFKGKYGTLAKQTN